MGLWIPPQHITCRVLALVWRGPELLMIRVNEEHGEVRGYRPIGGGVEFSETSLETIQREVREELGTEFQPKNFLGWVENIYTFGEHQGHELMALWEGSLDKAELYQQEQVPYIEADKIAKNCFMVWKNPFAADLPVWPEKMLEKLKDKAR
jgi:8-oxo-dGTP pyrophosphatase MutT (NUDIX family)